MVREQFEVIARAEAEDGANKAWNDGNARRVFLIRKRLRDGLSHEEQEELERLQWEMSKQLNSSSPLPFDALDKLEEFVEQAERRLSGK